MNGAPTARADWRRRGQAPGLVLALLAGATAFVLAGSGPAQAQSSPRPTITVAAAIVAQPAAQVPFPIGVGPTGGVPRNSFVRVRGLPPTAALSDGHSIAPGAWAVPLAALPNLQIMLPAGGTGRSEVVITLVAVDGTVLAEERSVLTVGPPRQPEKAETRRESAPAPPPTSASILRAGTPLRTTPESAERDARPAPPAAQKPATPQDKERALRLMKKGDEELAQGDVASARLLYERAADAGSAQAAMALAATFDPTELERLKVRGIAADTTAARRWYERARELGASGAEERLRRIGAR